MSSSDTGLSERERLARLRLARTDRIGPVTFRQLIARFGTALAAIEAIPAMTRKGGASLNLAPIATIEAEIRAADSCGAELIVLGDSDYPVALAHIDPPPPVLWIRGQASLLARPKLAIVGARIASAGGQRIARGLSQGLGQAGFIIASGLARGIDTAAHTGAVQTGTIAVLAGGVDDVYPSENKALYAEIVEKGCIVSENPMGARATARDFPRRNRIISGLSYGVVVVEAEIRSGSLITARLANEQGRDVFAVPGSPLDPRSRGPNHLIKQGATLCESVEDIIETLQTLRTLAEPPAEADFSGIPDDIDDALIERVAALLSPTPTPRDELARALNLPVALIAAALLELSLCGRASLLAGGLASL